MKYLKKEKLKKKGQLDLMSNSVKLHLKKIPLNSELRDKLFENTELKEKNTKDNEENGILRKNEKNTYCVVGVHDELEYVKDPKT